MNDALYAPREIGRTVLCLNRRSLDPVWIEFRGWKKKKKKSRDAVLLRKLIGLVWAKYWSVGWATRQPRLWEWWSFRLACVEKLTWVQWLPLVRASDNRRRVSGGRCCNGAVLTIVTWSLRRSASVVRALYCSAVQDLNKQGRKKKKKERTWGSGSGCS